MVTANLPRYLTLADAAEQFALGGAVLEQAIRDDTVGAIRLDGEVLVAEVDVALLAAQMQAEREGDELVSFNEAARRLNVNSGILSLWHKNGWLPEQGRGARRAILVSFNRAKALAGLREKQGQQGRRLLPRGADADQVLGG